MVSVQRPMAGSNRWVSGVRAGIGSIYRARMFSVGVGEACAAVSYRLARRLPLLTWVVRRSARDSRWTITAQLERCEPDKECGWSAER